MADINFNFNAAADFLKELDNASENLRGLTYIIQTESENLKTAWDGAGLQLILDYLQECRSEYDDINREIDAIRSQVENIVSIMKAAQKEEDDKRRKAEERAEQARIAELKLDMYGDYDAMLRERFRKDNDTTGPKYPPWQPSIH